MNKKLELIAKLLKEGKVTVSEAALLMEDKKEINNPYIPFNPTPFSPTSPWIQPNNPTNPYQGGAPFQQWYTNPWDFGTTCMSNLLNNFTIKN